MKTYLTILSVILFACAGSKNVQQEYPEYTITKITKLDDGQSIIYVQNNSENGIVISQNISSLGKSVGDIQVGKKYPLNLKKIERNFRGQNDAYGVTSSKGTETIVWKKEDNIPLVLYESYNLSGTTLFKSNKTF